MAICKKHPSEPAVGVCASCLRDRLLSLDSCITPRSCPPSSVHQEDPSSQPMLFGACPSPPEGKKSGFSVVSTLFGTPGGGPSPSGDRRFRGSDGRLPSLPPQRLDDATAVPPSFSSWFAALFDARSKRNKRPGCRTASTCDTGQLASSAGTSSAATSGTENKVDVDAPDAPLRRPTPRLQNYRGMSPSSEQQQEEEELQHEEREQNRAAASFASGSSPSTSGSNHQVLPCATPARTLGRRNPAVVEAGFVVCFSPLVHARQHHHRRSLVVARDSGGAQDGEQNNPVFRLRPLQGQHPHQHHRLLRHGTGGGGGVRLGPNRSRKLVDMGRFR